MLMTGKHNVCCKQYDFIAPGVLHAWISSLSHTLNLLNTKTVPDVVPAKRWRADWVNDWIVEDLKVGIVADATGLKDNKLHTFIVLSSLAV